MSTLDLLDDSFPHGTPNGYRRGCRTAACPALIPCRTVHTRYVGDFSFARLFDAGTPLAEILERDAAARDEARQSDKIAARKERHAAAMAARPRRAKPTPTPTPRAKRAAAPKPARQPQPASDERLRPSTPAAPRTRTHASYQWIDRARAAAGQLPQDLVGAFTQAVDRYEADLDRHVDELAQWRDEQRDLRDRLRAATETLKTATIAAGTGLSVGGVIERALHNATVQHQAATDALAAHARPTPPAKPRMPRPRRKPRDAHRSRGSCSPMGPMPAGRAAATGPSASKRDASITASGWRTGRRRPSRSSTTARPTATSSAARTATTARPKPRARMPRWPKSGAAGVKPASPRKLRAYPPSPSANTSASSWPPA